MSEFISKELQEEYRRIDTRKIRELAIRLVPVLNANPGRTCGELADMLGCGIGVFADAHTYHVEWIDGTATFKERKAK